MALSRARTLRAYAKVEFLPKARRMALRVANRLERREARKEIKLALVPDLEPVLVPHPDDETCHFCGSLQPSHRMAWVKQRTIGPCDCCEHWEEVPFCSKCFTAPTSEE